MISFTLAPFSNFIASLKLYLITQEKQKKSPLFGGDLLKEKELD
jgi:hypothetical protein